MKSLKRYTSKEEKTLLETNPADSVFIVGLSTGSSMACYPTIINTLKLIGRAPNQVEASTSLSLLISRLGNVVYNVIAIVFALNLYEVRLSPIILLQVIIFSLKNNCLFSQNKKILAIISLRTWFYSEEYLEVWLLQCCTELPL